MKLDKKAIVSMADRYQQEGGENEVLGKLQDYRSGDLGMVAAVAVRIFRVYGNAAAEKFCNELSAGDLVPDEDVRFASTAWILGDLDQFDATDEEKLDWLRENERHLRDLTGTAGNTFIEDTCDLDRLPDDEV